MDTIVDQLVKLAPGSRVIVRDTHQLQFGLDATRCGVITMPDHVNVTQVATALSTLSAPTPRSRALSRLRATGIDAPTALSMIDELIAFRILHVAVPARVSLIGHGTLAQQTTSVLLQMGVDVSRPDPVADVHQFLRDQAPDEPLVIASPLSPTGSTVRVLAECVETWVLGAIIDNRGMVGPLRINGEGPCPMCVDLHRADVDPRWGQVARQQFDATAVPDPAALSATAATLAVTAASLAGAPDPPGIRREQLSAGAVTQIDPATGFRRFAIHRHRLCPLCFYRN